MNWFKQVLVTLGSLFHSKKFLVAAGGVVAAVVSGTPVGTAVLAGASAYVLGQGVADHGKDAARIAAKLP